MPYMNRGISHGLAAKNRRSGRWRGEFRHLLAQRKSISHPVKEKKKTAPGDRGAEQGRGYFSPFRVPRSGFRVRLPTHAGGAIS